MSVPETRTQAMTTGSGRGHTAITSPTPAAAAGIAVKCASDALVSRRLRGTLPRAAEFLVMPVKDLAIAAVWLVGCFRRRVSWRGNELRIERGSRLTAAGAQPIEVAQEAA